MDDDDFLLPKVLCVEERQLADFDPDQPPSNGHEYLFAVKKEAAHCPQTSVADVSRRKFKKQTYFVEEENLPQCLPELLPTREWQMTQVADFSRLRLQIDRRKAFSVKEKPSLQFPEDENSWFKFCLGKDGHQVPLLSTLLSMGQGTLDNLLAKFVWWLEDGKTDFNDATLIWLYALLARIESPLLPSVCASIRALARAAITRRATIKSSEDPMCIPLNLIICIVARYFRQFDLSD